MTNIRIRIEVYEDDPFGSSCCGSNFSTNSLGAVDKIRQMLTERFQIIEKISKEFKDAIQVEREIVSPKRWNYPQHVKSLMFDNKSLPYVFINGEAVSVGKFPTYEEFATLISSYVKSARR